MNLSRGKYMYIHYCDTMYFTQCDRLGVGCKWSLGEYMLRVML